MRSAIKLYKTFNSNVYWWTVPTQNWSCPQVILFLSCLTNVVAAPIGYPTSITVSPLRMQFHFTSSVGCHHGDVESEYKADTQYSNTVSRTSNLY
ncbi:hypothetical protein F4680DRAFT_439518 [Xylaria scruposa]|nr:hypothetical protein F4680DRAFT_439518 [Xylaria scruposa]